MVRLKDFTKLDQQFVNLLNDAQRRADSLGRIPSKRTGHWASEALSSCLRKSWLSWKALPTNEFGNLDTFALGNSIEDAVVKKFQSAGIVLRQQEHITIDDARLQYPITGKIDLLIIEGDDIITPVEIKSTKDYGENDGYDKWMSYLPREEHVAQLSMYLHARKATHGYLAYFNKNRGIMAIYKVDYEPEFYNFVIEQFVLFEKELAGPEPEIPKGMKPESFPCGWMSRAPDAKAAKKMEGTCQYWNHCWKGQKLVTLFAEENPAEQPKV